MVNHIILYIASFLNFIMLILLLGSDEGFMQIHSCSLRDLLSSSNGI